jgi:hypothetical protein
MSVREKCTTLTDKLTYNGNVLADRLYFSSEEVKGIQWEYRDPMNDTGHMEQTQDYIRLYNNDVNF